MSDNLPQITAILRAIEERLTALMDLQTDPEGRVSQAQTDSLRAYGMVAQIAELMGIQRNQILALSDAIAVLVARFVEHDRRVAVQHAAILELLGSVAHGVGLAAIAADAAQAKAALQAEAEERAAELELAAGQAIESLRTARTAARSVISSALNRAEQELTAHADAARTVVTDAEQTARDVIKDAEQETL